MLEHLLRESSLNLKKEPDTKGLAKVQMQLFMEALVWNVKRLVQINPPPLVTGA